MRIPLYANRICKSPIIFPDSAPSNAHAVHSIPTIINGSNTGNESTVNREFFTPAFEIMAEITVEEEPIPIPAKNMIIIKETGL